MSFLKHGNIDDTLKFKFKFKKNSTTSRIEGKKYSKAKEYNAVHFVKRFSLNRFDTTLPVIHFDVLLAGNLSLRNNCLYGSEIFKRTTSNSKPVTTTNPLKSLKTPFRYIHTRSIQRRHSIHSTWHIACQEARNLFFSSLSLSLHLLFNRLFHIKSSIFECFCLSHVLPFCFSQ
jgi:hypothetical protein